jgi:hypothetical protein
MAGWGKKDLMLHISTRCETELTGFSLQDELFLALMNLLPAESATINTRMLTYTLSRVWRLYKTGFGLVIGFIGSLSQLHSIAT